MRTYKYKNIIGINKDIQTFSSVKRQYIDDALSTLSLPEEFKEFYQVTNGITYDWFRILPIYDTGSIKKTWDSIQAANSKKNKFNLPSSFLEENTIFAEIGAGEIAIYNKKNRTILYEENEQFIEVNTSLYDFIETSIKEVIAL